MKEILRHAREVIQIEAEAVQSLLDRLDENFIRAVEALLACEGRVMSDLVVAFYDHRYAQKIVTMDLKGYIRGQRDKALSGEITDAISIAGLLRLKHSL